MSVPHDLGEGPEPLMIQAIISEVTRTVRWYWNAPGAARSYDILTGDIGNLRAEDARIALGPIRMRGCGLVATSLDEAATASLPEPGHADFYLVQYHDEHGATGFGTESASLPREPDSCDMTCPGS